MAVDEERRKLLKWAGKLTPAAIAAALLTSTSGGGFSQTAGDARYIRKTPNASDNIITPTDFSIVGLKLKQTGIYNGLTGFLTIRDSADDDLGWDISASDASALVPTIRAALPDSFNSTSSFLSTVKRPSNLGYSAIGLDVGNGLGLGADAILLGDNVDIIGTSGPIISRTKHIFTGQIGGGFLGTGAMVGLPTGTAGSDGFPTAATHRHAFSGRFMDGSLTLPVALGAAGPFPLNIGLRINLSNWTLRRVSVYTMVAPTGGTETYGIVNAAGALQGTAVVLAAGTLFTVGALQVTNLIGNTNYFFAQTAATALTPSNNTKVSAEYTMNV